MSHTPNMDRFSEFRDKPWTGRHNPSDEPLDDETNESAQEVKLALEQDRERIEFLKKLNRVDLTKFELDLIDSMCRQGVPLDFVQRVVADDIRRKYQMRQVNVPEKGN